MSTKKFPVWTSRFQGVVTTFLGIGPWAPLAGTLVPTKAVRPLAPVIKTVKAPPESVGTLQIELELPSANTDGSPLALAELVRLRLHYQTSSGVSETSPHNDFAPANTLLWAPGTRERVYIRVRVQDSHGAWSGLSNEVHCPAPITHVEAAQFWAHRLNPEAIFTHNSPSPGRVSWSNVKMRFRDKEYPIQNGNTDRKFIWWDFDFPNVFQATDTVPTLALEDVVVAYNDGGFCHVMTYKPTLFADYIRAGELRSRNWGPNTGSHFDLDAGTFRLGGWTAPRLSWDGTTLTVRGAIRSEAGSLLDGMHLKDLSITTAKIADLAINSAKVSELVFNKISAGTNTASLIIGSGGFLGSENFVSGSRGFRIWGTGEAEFNKVVVKADAGSILITGTVRRADIGRTEPHDIAIYDTVGARALYLYPHAIIIENVMWLYKMGNSPRIDLEGPGKAKISNEGDGFELESKQGVFRIDTSLLTGASFRVFRESFIIEEDDIVVMPGNMYVDWEYRGLEYTGPFQTPAKGIYCYVGGQRYAIPLYGPV